VTLLRSFRDHCSAGHGCLITATVVCWRYAGSRPYLNTAHFVPASRRTCLSCLDGEWREVLSRCSLQGDVGDTIEWLYESSAIAVDVIICLVERMVLPAATTMVLLVRVGCDRCLTWRFHTNHLTIGHACMFEG